MKLILYLAVGGMIGGGLITLERARVVMYRRQIPISPASP